MRTRLCGSILAALAALSLASCHDPVFPTKDATITLLAISGVHAPVTGATPETSLDASQYTGSIEWRPSSSAVFAANTAYTATITLKPKDGYTFTNVSANSFTVDGAASVSNSANSGVVTAVFPPTSSASITLLAIPGVVAPVTGATPGSSLDASQYTGTIVWNPSVHGAFSASVAYTANITLTPKSGYTFAGVTANSFAVDGAASVSNRADSAYVKAVFPMTGPKLSAVSDVASTNIGTLKGVQGGTFAIQPANNTTVSSFRMSQYEITGAQYAAIMGVADPSSFSSVPGHPVEQVNWYAAIVFCNKLSALEGLTPVYSINGRTDTAVWGAIPTSSNAIWDTVVANWGADGYRLPTDMEWLWAAMGGANDARSGDIVGGVNAGGYTKGYAGSTETASAQASMGVYSWYSVNSGGATHQVGGKAANELGLYDMSGNVREWCWDWWDTMGYPVNSTDYRGADTGTIRGGRDFCWNDNPSLTNLASRLMAHPSDRYPYVGFRVVRP